MTKLKWVLYVILVLAVIGGIKAYDLYRKAFADNIILKDGKPVELFIKTGWDYDSVSHAVKELDIVKNNTNLKWVMEKKNYPRHIYPGRYLISRDMNNSDFVDMLRSGNQKPVSFSFNNMVYLKDFCELAGTEFEFNGDELLSYIASKEVLKEYGFNEYSINCMFIPNTYEINWSISIKDFVNRMKKEYDMFWNARRVAKAQAIGLKKDEVIILASIVNSENLKHSSEWRTIAGVYMNRLNNSWPLQADPTLSYANGISVRRHLNKDKEVDSPFNTYANTGLPPGPIRFPDIGAIDAVLDYERHDYFYMVASTSGGGKHEFNKTLDGHNRDRQKYINYLNKKGIRR
ncbi:MAG: endolytic transglycosylase MltG [Bacteroidales bacterium]|nr:endolytic transglycosylase MltG [Bacteroidales bacterium]